MKPIMFLKLELHFAAKQSNYEIIKLSLEFGADFRSRDSKGRTACDIGVAFRLC